MNSSPESSFIDIQSSWGVIQVLASNGLITSCRLPRLKAEPSKPFRLEKTTFYAATRGEKHILNKATVFVAAVFSGKQAKPPPFQWPDATPFTTRVWKALMELEAGHEITYSALARKIGRSGGARAVGRACGANPLPLFIPCHRVLPCDGSLGGFSCGLPWKRHLLEVERGHLKA